METLEIRHYTEEEARWVAYPTGVVTCPPKVRLVYNPPHGHGWWILRAAIVEAVLDGAKVDEIILEGRPTEDEIQEAKRQMEAALRKALAERCRASA